MKVELDAQEISTLIEVIEFWFAESEEEDMEECDDLHDKLSSFLNEALEKEDE